MARIYTYIVVLFSVLGLCFTVSNEASAQNIENKFSINNSEAKMTIYPVPASNYVNIYLSPSLRQVTDKIEILNLTGRVVLEQKLISNNTSEVSFNNLSAQPAGVYIVSSKDKEGKIIQSGKLIIRK